MTVILMVHRTLHLKHRNCLIGPQTLLVMFVNANHCTVSNSTISAATTISTVMPVTFTGATNSTTSAGANHSLCK